MANAQEHLEVTVSLQQGFEVRIAYREDVVIPPYPISSLLIANNIRLYGQEKTLDIGTGTGILAIVAKKLGASHVVATDLSDEVLQYAKENFQSNNVDCQVRRSDLFKDIPETDFDLIIANPPMFASKRGLSPDIYGGPSGRNLLDRIIRESAGHLNPGGRLLIPTESYLGFDETERLLKEENFGFKVIAQGSAPCGLQMLRDLNFGEMKGQLIKHHGIFYFSSNIYEATKNV